MGGCGGGGQGADRAERRGVYKVLVRTPEVKRPLGGPRCRWEDNITIDPHEVGCGGMDCIDLAQDRDKWRALVSECGNEPSGSIQCRVFLD